jgi:hypothetical protein
MSDTSEQFIYSEELYQLPSRVIVLIPVPWNEMSEAEKSLLTKILSAAKLSVQGVQILQDKNVTIESLKIYNPAAVISFGVSIIPSVKSYSAETINGINVIQSDALGSLSDSSKKDLWNALKSWLAG